MSEDSDKKPHFWINDGDVDYIDNDPRSRSTPISRDYSVHGATLTTSIQQIKSLHSRKTTPISNEKIIFKINLPQDEVADSRKYSSSIFRDNKLSINALSKKNEAIVSTSIEYFEEFFSKILQYKENEGKRYNNLKYIEDITPMSIEEYDFIADEDSGSINLQVTLLPKLENQEYESLVVFLGNMITEVEGYINYEESFVLPDNTPVLNVILPSSGALSVLNQEFIYRAEPTRFFEISQSTREVHGNISDFELDSSVDIDELPIVCILDDGVHLPDNLNSLLVDQRVSSPDITEFTANHGTKVATRIIFGDDFEQQLRNGILVPKARVISVIFTSGNGLDISEASMVNAIRFAVNNYSSATSTFCLAYNATEPIKDTSVSNLAFEIDAQVSKGINFVVPTGNHKLYEAYRSDVSELLDDDQVRLACPAESLHALTIGSIANKSNEFSLFGDHKLSPFSRIGNGFCGFLKPELVYPGGNISIVQDELRLDVETTVPLINSQGGIEYDHGTSFATPLAASDLARLTEVVPEKDPLIARGLLLHHSKKEILESPELFHDKIFGLGQGDYESAISSIKKKVTYIRRGKIKRSLKERVKFWIPSEIAQLSVGKGIAPSVRLTVTCLSVPPVDKAMGEEYLRAYITTSLHYLNSNGNDNRKNPSGELGRTKWRNLHHFSQELSNFKEGDWQLWLSLMSKPELDNSVEVEYVLLITIENLSRNDLDLHQSILNETESRFVLIQEVDVDVNT